MPASGVHFAPADRETRDGMRRDGGRPAIGRRSAGTGVHVIVRKSCCLSADQADDSLRFDGPTARAGGADTQNAEAEGSRGKSARGGLSHMKPDAARLWAYVSPYGWVLAASLFLVTVVGLLEAVAPFLIGIIFDTLLRASPAPSITVPVIDARLNVTALDGRVFLVLLVVVTVIKTMAEYGSINAIAYLGQAVVRDLRNDAFDKILLQPLRFFHFNPTGELISRVSADIERIQTAASETLAEFLKQTAILIFLLIAIFAIDWKLAAMSVVLVPFVFYPTLWFGKRLRALGKSTQEEMAEMANLLYETVTGNRIVKAFTMEKAEAGKFRKVAERIFKLNLRQKMTHSLSSP